MKNLLAIFALLFLSPVWVWGQTNLVPNPSFEDTINCPTGGGQVTTHCAAWRQYTNGTSDFFHSCSSSPFVNVPYNAFGYQAAAHGNAHAGFYEYVPAADQREYIACAITPMQKGKVYEVSVSLSLGDSCRYASNGIGVFFYDSGPSQIATIAMLPYTPQVSYSSYGPITNKTGWTRLTKYMYADSAYDNMIIGGFVPYSSLQVTTTGSNSYLQSYYLIDSVVVTKASNITVSIADSLLCAGDTVSLNYNLLLNHLAGNVFTAQLSDRFGSFSSPVNIGSATSITSGNITCVIPPTTSIGTNYRIRVVSSNWADTSEDNGFNIKIGNVDSAVVSASQNSPICEGSTLAFTGSSNITGTTYLWSGPNSFTSNLQSPTIGNATVALSGIYYSDISIYGCVIKDTLAVTVKPLPVKPVASDNGPLCAGSTLNLAAATSTGGVSWSWAGPGSFTSTTQNPSISNSTTAMSGDYIVTATLNGCNRKDTTTVLVKPMPAAVTTSNNSPVCAGDSLQLTVSNSTTGATYAWAGPNSFTATTQNTSIPNSTVAATGWYHITVDLNGCTYKDSSYTVVNAIPAMPTISYNSPLCIGETLSLNAGNVAGAGYIWTGPNNFSSSVQNSTRSSMQFGDTGTYKVKATVNGCTSAERTASIYINATPFVVILANPADTICKGTPVVFTALPNNHGGTPAYQWYVNVQAAGTGTIFATSTLNDGDVIRCDMTENTKCSAPYKDESNDIEMTVLPWLAPAVSIAANPNTPLKENEYVTFTATPTDAGKAPTYQWKRNGQNVIGATSNIWSANTLNDNDEICVELISNYKCPQPATAKSNCIIVKVLTGVGDIQQADGIVLYPNPNNGKFALTSPHLNFVGGRQGGPISIEITNSLGQVVYHDKNVPVNGKLYKEINLSGVAAGVYMLRLHTENEVSMIRFNVK